MTSRYSLRKAIECQVSIISGGMLGQGRVLDLSVPGCLLQTGLHLEAGQSLQLKLMFPTGKPLGVTLAIVRWVNGWKAGVEFIRMSEEDQALLRIHVGFVKRRHTSAWSERVLCTGISGI